MKKVFLILLFVLAVFADCEAAVPETFVQAEIVAAHRAKDFGDEMFYLYKTDETLYIVMHGQENGTMMDGISVKSAVRKVLKESREKLAGNPFGKVFIICCYSKAHDGYFDKDGGYEVAFLVDSSKELKVHLTNHGFSYVEE